MLVQKLCLTEKLLKKSIKSIISLRNKLIKQIELKSNKKVLN